MDPSIFQLKTWIPTIAIVTFFAIAMILVLALVQANENSDQDDLQMPDSVQDQIKEERLKRKKAKQDMTEL